MPAIVDLLAHDFGGRMALVTHDPEIRVLVTAGVLVTIVAVGALLAADDAVEIIPIGDVAQ